MRKFWNWVTNLDGERTLYLDGYIAQDSWLNDDITPQQFKRELDASVGDISVWINSPGGDVFASSQIYNMIRAYPGKVTVKIDGLAASAGSVIAMAGDEVVISPVGLLMVHNPATMIFGEEADLQIGIQMLNEVKESIVNAYERKTGLDRKQISKMMDAETWMNAKKAVELGFADRILFEDKIPELTDAFMFDKVTVTNSFINKLPKIKKQDLVIETGTPYSQLIKRLDLLKSHKGGF
jgi:ATP-dependent Clp protease, protease subunit